MSQTSKNSPEHYPPGNGNGKHSIALWAGLTTFFTNLAAVHIVAILGNTDDETKKAIGAVLTSFLVAGSVYAKQRWDEEKEKKTRRDDTS